MITWSTLLVLDRERILARLDDLEGYLRELRQVVPSSFEGFRRVETKRACERLLQISIESAIDVCGLLVAGLLLGLPAEEEDVFEKLETAGIVSPELGKVLRRMRGLRNILVHEYGRVNDRIVFEVLKEKLGDFVAFKDVVLDVLKKNTERN